MNQDPGHQVEPKVEDHISSTSNLKRKLLIVVLLLIIPAAIGTVFWLRGSNQLFTNLDPVTSQAANTIIVNAGGDLQAAINQAQLGDEIVVQAGATFTGNFFLPYKNTGTGYVTIRSSNLAQLPPEGQRVSPADAVNMPKIQTPNNAPVFYTESGATPSHHYKLIGLEITRPANSSQVTALVEFGSNYDDQDTLAEVPHNFIVDRSYVHGHTNSPTRRGFKIESKDTEIRNSYISAFHESGYDSQAILSVNGPGNHIIFNNYLEAASENIMYGGDDPIIPGLVPTNILIEHNHFFKPLSWRGRNLAVKNLFELKNSKDVIVQYNIFENSWYEAQAGYGIVITPRSAGNAPWSTVDNTIIRYNIIKNTGNGISLFGSDYASNIQAMDRFTLEHNLFLVAGPTMDGNGIGMCISGRQNFPGQDVNITHNTFIANGRTLECAEGRVFTNFNFNDNIVASAGSDQGLIGQLTNGGAYGNAFMNLAFGNTWQYRNNVSQLDAYWRTNHPNTSTYVDNNSAFGFQNVSGGIYKLAANSPFKNTATDGTDPGVNWDELMARTANVVSGASTGGGTTPPPSDTTPPSMSAGSPSGAQAAGTTQANLTLSTNESATCKYGTATGQTYANKPNTFSTTGSTSHSTQVTGLTNGQSYNYYVRCQDSAGNANTSDLTISFSVSNPAGDTTAPTVSLTAPANGATVSGTSVTVSATASDNVGIVGVQFKLNGTNLGAEDTSSPYSIIWNSTTASNGEHTLTAVARDAAGNSTTSSAHTVTVSNVTAPSTAATPTISPNGGSFTSAQTVTLASTTPDALIYYTTNGSDPTTSSTLYSTPFQVSISSTVKAIATKSGMTNSSVSSATFTITAPSSGGGGGGGGSSSGGGGGGSSSPRPPSSPTTPSGVVLPPNSIAGQTIKFANNPTVYLVMSTGLHPFDTLASLQAYQAQSGAVIITRTGTASTYTVSSTMAKDILAQHSGGSSEPTPTQPSTGNPANNTDFTCEGNPTVYYYSDGQKKAYTELAVFQAWNGNDFSKVTKHSASVCSSITSGPIVRLPEGTIIKVPNGPEIYMVAGSTARPFSSFSAYQRDSAGKTTYTVSIPYLHTYSRGANIN